MKYRYAYLWEFTVLPELQAEFERHYGPEGTWVQLFRCSAGFIETILLRDNAVAGRYVTVDRWQSQETYLAFREEFASQYARLDKECERLTARETSLGVFGESIG